MSRLVWRDEGWVRPYLRKYRRALALALALAVAASAFACGLMFTSGYMISLAAAAPLTVLALHVPSLFVRIFGIGKPLLRYGEKIVSHDWVLRMTSEMRLKLYTVLERRAGALETGRERTTQGSVLALLTDDIGHVQNLIMRSVLPLGTTWLFAVVVVAACGVLSWQLAGIMAATLVLVGVVVPLFSAAANAARTEAAKVAQAAVYEGLTDDILGITDWVLSGRRDDYLHRLDARLAERDSARQALSAFERRMELLSQAVFCLCIVAVLVWAASAFCDGQATGLLAAIADSGSENAPVYPPNWIAAFILCLFPILEALAPLPAAALGLTEQRDALIRLNDFSSNSGTATMAPASAPSSPPDKPEIAIDSLSFAYPGAEPVISGLSLAIPYGQSVAITGRSGAGKTTLAKLIHGDMRPSAGSVQVGGREAHTWGDAMAGIVGVLDQAPKLFAFTLRDNLAIGNPHATDEQMIEALHAVGLRERFERLPRGLDSLVEEGAFNFSGGEAHRIALARILLADQPIVILDEPFAALDPATERATLAATLHALAGKTIIAITHNPETAAAFERTLALEPTMGT